MSDTRQQTTWLMEALPNCANVFKSTETGWPKWGIVRLEVACEEAVLADMKKTFWEYTTRTKALAASKEIAKSVDPNATESGHKGVWKIEKDGKTFWQTVWPIGF